MQVNVVITITGAMPMQDRIIGSRSIPFHKSLPRTKSPALFHGLEDEVHSIATCAFHTPQVGRHIILFAHVIFGPLQWESPVACERSHPAHVILCAAAEHFFGNGLYTEY